MRNAFLAAWVAVAATSVYAQTSAAPRSPEPAAKPPATLKIGNVEVTGAIRLRAYGWDWFEPASGDNSYGYSGNQLRINFAERIGRWDWSADFALPIMLGMPDSATAPAPQGALGLGSNYYTANGSSRNSAMLFAKQAFVRYRGLGGASSFLRVGRFEFLDGSEMAPKNAALAAVKAQRVSQRLFANFGWSETGRSFDGVHYSWQGTKSNFTIIAATPTRGAFQTDGWGWMRIGTGYASYTQQWGKGKHSADTRLFVLEYDDFRHILKTDNRALATRRTDLQNIRIETFGGHSVHAFQTSKGVLDLVAFAAVQTGRWGTQKHRAGTFDLEVGLQPKALSKLKPWLRAGYTWGSGDGNPNDGTHGTFFQALPTPRVYARFPFFNMMNTGDAYGSMVLRPRAKVTTSTEFHSLRLANANDLWYSGGGAFQPWTFGFAGRATAGRRSLGNLYDTSVEWRVNPKIAITTYVGYTQGLAAMQQIYPNGKNGMFGYIEFLNRF